MAKERVTDELLHGIREELERLRDRHYELLNEARIIAPASVAFYDLIWNMEEQRLREFDGVVENIRLADFLLHKPRTQGTC
jgi:hypothetical protein